VNSRGRLARISLSANDPGLATKRYCGALAAAERASEQSGFYQNAWLRGRALLGSERNEEAVTALKLRLLHNRLSKRKQEIETWLERAKINQ
jgi:hypothetical protein